MREPALLIGPMAAGNVTGHEIKTAIFCGIMKMRAIFAHNSFAGRSLGGSGASGAGGVSGASGASGVRVVTFGGEGGPRGSPGCGQGQGVEGVDVRDTKIDAGEGLRAGLGLELFSLVDQHGCAPILISGVRSTTGEGRAAGRVRTSESIVIR